jgi:hypothetical protein
MRKVQIDHGTCPFGGARPWFLCPDCRRRVGSLYLRKEPALEIITHGRSTVAVPEREVLACRHCLRLQYDSQAENEVGRSLRRTRKLSAKLAKGSLRRKPKWMRWPTFERLCRLLRHERNLRAELEVDESARHGDWRAEIPSDPLCVRLLTDRQIGQALDRLHRSRDVRNRQS